ncbi:MAG TPA: PQQ-dependent sugar dehydrogenase [Acidobacteriota bacterium]|jgi:uncharacterized repeat protein (TIGR01451 family)
MKVDEAFFGRRIAALAGIVVSLSVSFIRAQGEGAPQLSMVTAGLSSPLFVTHAGDGSDRLFILEQGGRIRIFKAGALLATPFLDISGIIESGGEKGLLGLAFHPDYRNNGRFFVNFTRRVTGQLKTFVAEYRVSSGNPDIAGTTEFPVLDFDQPYDNHNGGMLAFGPDGYLYISSGDGGSGGDPLNNAQRINTLLGKMLRIDIDTAPYAMPPDNPFVGQPGARGEIWAYGLRNPWRFSFDRLDGRLFLGDVGQSTREEVDLIIRGGNYGWRIMEGSICFSPSSGCNTSGLIMPLTDYGRTEGQSVTGGYVYRGRQQTVYAGSYIFGDYGSGRIWALTESGGVWTRTQILMSGFSISSFGEDENGELYVVDYSGSVRRMVFAPAQGVADAAMNKRHRGNFLGGGSGIYTLSVQNLGTVASSGVVTVTDVLPAGLSYQSASGSGWSCSPSSQTVTCTSSGALAAGAGSTILMTVAVSVTAAQYVTNTVSVSNSSDAVAANNSASDPTVVIAPADFFTLTPCRVADTRNPNGAYGGPALPASGDRIFVIAGRCGVPATARSVSVNITVTQPTGVGHLRLYPAGSALPASSNINYSGGQTRANNAVLTLGPAGDLAVRCEQISGTVHFILDVNGYFQ